MKIAELVDALTDAKLALSDAKEALADQARQIEALKINFQTKANLVRGEGDYLYFAEENGEPLGFPICPSCEIDGKLVQLKRDGKANKTKCPRCKSEYAPVSCFLAASARDRTLHEKESRESSEAWQRAAQRQANLNRGDRGFW
jgi:hypothetical protein